MDGGLAFGTLFFSLKDTEDNGSGCAIAVRDDRPSDEYVPRRSPLRQAHRVGGLSEREGWEDGAQKCHGILNGAGGGAAGGRRGCLRGGLSSDGERAVPERR